MTRSIACGHSASLPRLFALSALVPVTVFDDDRPHGRPYITEFALPQMNTTPVILKRGSDNALWFTERGTS